MASATSLNGSWIASHIVSVRIKKAAFVFGVGISELIAPITNLKRRITMEMTDYCSYELSKALKACGFDEPCYCKWAAVTGRKPFFNYCVHRGNSTSEDTERLTRVFNPDVWEVTLSVICQKSESVKNSIERQLDLIDGFRKLMLEKGFSMRVFNPAGQDDIGSGCGQLWYFQKWLKENHAK